MGNEDIRLQISNILDQVRTQPRRRAIEPALAVGEFLRSRDPASEDEVQAVTEMAVDEQLSRGHPGMVEDALLALAEVATANLSSMVARISVANLAITACMVVDRLARLGWVTPEEQVGASSYANLLDDRLVRGHGRYPRRIVLLRLLRDGLERASDHCRHLDLVARFKWAVELAATNDAVLTGEAVEALRALIPAIEQRIHETVDAPGPGVCPDGSPVVSRRIAGAIVYVGPLELVERYRSLPRLKAQALFERGRLLASFTFSSSTAGLEEAHEVFERASIAFHTVSDARWSAYCAVAAAQCLTWLSDDPTGPHARRLLDYGPAAHRQVLATGLPGDLKLALAALAKSAYQRMAWRVRLRAASNEAEVETAVKSMYGEAAIHLGMLCQHADTEPWSALACGSAAIEHVADFLEAAEWMMQPPANEEERRAREDRALETLRFYVTPGVVDAMPARWAARSTHPDPICATLFPNHPPRTSGRHAPLRSRWRGVSTKLSRRCCARHPSSAGSPRRNGPSWLAPWKAHVRWHWGLRRSWRCKRGNAGRSPLRQRPGSRRAQWPTLSSAGSPASSATSRARSSRSRNGCSCRAGSLASYSTAAHPPTISRTCQRRGRSH